jgi:hypothetical protein
MRKSIPPQKAQRRTQKAQKFFGVGSLFYICFAPFVFFFVLFVALFRPIH